MEKSSFFNSVSGDRTYKAEDWASYFASLVGNGIFPTPSTNLQVIAGEGMNVTVKTGRAWINGYFYTNTSDFTLTLNTADGVLKRIDRIVVRWDFTNRLISIKVKSSTSSSSPSAPALQRDAGIYELCIADVAVNAGVTNIGQANITDRRLDISLCGIVAALVDQIDTTAFNAQMEAWLVEYQNILDNEYVEFQGSMNSFKNNSAEDFNTWFQGIQDVLDEDTAGNLLNLINGKVDIEDGKGLSTCDYTIADKSKVTNAPEIVVSTMQPEAVEGRIWIKI